MNKEEGRPDPPVPAPGPGGDTSLVGKLGVKRAGFGPAVGPPGKSTAIKRYAARPRTTRKGRTLRTFKFESWFVRAHATGSVVGKIFRISNAALKEKKAAAFNTLEGSNFEIILDNGGVVRVARQARMHLKSEAKR